MKNLFQEFAPLWPESSHSALMPLLSKINFLNYPKDKAIIESADNSRKTVVILDSGDIKEIIQILSLGYSHCVQRSRPDFAQELLASALMTSKPDNFVKNPIPFFFTGFAAASHSSTETNISIPFRKSSDKNYILQRLSTFLTQNKKLEGISDLCLQVADELMMNALYSAPVDSRGNSLYQNIDRACEVVLRESDQATFFSCFSDYRVIIGCEDPFGSFKKEKYFQHLKDSFLFNKSEARKSSSGGAGLGSRYIIDNSANFYLYCDPGKKSLVASAFILQGLKANLTSKKHFHLSIG